MLLLDAVGAETCAQIGEDMEPYLQAAQARHVRESSINADSGGGAAASTSRSASDAAASIATRGPTTRVDALPARSDASWPLVAHPALMKVCEAVIGRQVRPQHTFQNRPMSHAVRSQMR